MRQTKPRAVHLSAIRVDPALAGERRERLAFLDRGPVEIALRKPITILTGENGSGKTTLLEAVAARCAIRPDGGESYSQWDDDREDTALSDAVALEFPHPGRRPKGLFVRADRLVDMAAEIAEHRGELRMATTDEWRRLDEQSRGESVLSLLSASLEASEAMLYILDEPEAALSPNRQLSLLCLLDQIHKDGRSQVLMATHAPILMSHPEADILWIDETGVAPRALEDVDHWRLMQRFMRDPQGYLRRLLTDEE